MPDSSNPFSSCNFDMSVAAAVKSLASRLIDCATRQRVGTSWRQFPLMEYGLCTKASWPDPDDGYRAALAAHLPLDLSSEEHVKAAALAEDLIDAIKNDDLAIVNDVLGKLDADAARMKELQRDVDELIQKHVPDMQQTARTAVEFDRASIAFHEWLTRSETEPLFKALFERIATDERIDAVAEFSGARLLERWRALYIDSREPQLYFLVQKDEPKRRRRRREIFGGLIAKLIAAAKQLNAAADELFYAVEAEIGKRPIQPSLPQMLLQLRTSAILLQSRAHWLADESRDQIEARLDLYRAIADNELRAWRAKATDGYQLACDQLRLLLDLDGERLFWAADSSMKLESLKDVLDRLLPP